MVATAEQSSIGGLLSQGISNIDTFSAMFSVNRDKPVVIGGGNRSTLMKPPPNHKSLATVLRGAVGS